MPDPSPPPYLSAVLALAGPAPPGQVTDVFVLHDDACPLLAGGACACTPTVTRGFVLWWRPKKGKPWQPVATVATQRAAWALVGSGGRKSGDYACLPAGTEP